MAGSDSMRYQGIVVFGLAVFAAISLGAGYSVPLMLMLPALTAYFTVRGRYTLCLVIAGTAAALPVAAHAYLIGMLLLAAAFSGVMLGALMRVRLSLGTCIALITGIVFILDAGYTWLTWPSSKTDYMDAIAAYGERVKAGDENADHLMTLLTWMGDNWLYTSFGIAFGGILLGVTVIQYLLYRSLTAQGLIAPLNSHFSRMRVPEHLVWVAIALAGLWFLDKWQPNEIVRFVAWNGAIAMAFVYWLNGLSIVFFWIKVLQPRPVFILLLLVAAFVFNFHQLFAVAGFFDTWFDFRVKIARIAAERIKQE
jgi:hypothetical protein